MKNFITVIGARPQFVKAAALSRVIQSDYSDVLCEKIIHTGQHYDFNMSDSFFEELGIPKPYKNLNINSTQYSEPTGMMINELYEEFRNQKPDFVLVYGDTNSTLAAAIAAGKLYIPLVHIEGGVRNIDTKVPEHFNRVLTDHASEMIFCISNDDLLNLQREGLGGKSYKSGDIMLDTVRMFREEMNQTVQQSNRALLTIHRNFNTDDPVVLNKIFDNIGKLECEVDFPVHPRTKAAIERFGIKLPANIILHQPYSYLEMLGALNSCKYVLTDSGGLQKEAFYFGKKAVFICHFDTFWQDLVNLGALITVSPHDDLKRHEGWLNEPLDTTTNPYGSGHSSKMILDTILEKLL
ncbi:MAG: UDP-N-acetylglucosamine 2-epimerase [Moraxella sp.]|nr:UDP-N-acetylglucosamine 2-epimerase [Moraxella sp.]